MATSLSWTEIRKSADAAGFFHGWMGAEQNAAETIQVEKAAPAEDFDRIALNSLREYLAYGTLDPAEHAFFVSLGIDY